MKTLEEFVTLFAELFETQVRLRQPLLFVTWMNGLPLSLRTLSPWLTRSLKWL